MRGKSLKGEFESPSLIPDKWGGVLLREVHGTMYMVSFA